MKRAGIIGGLGPLAGSDLYKKVIEESQAFDDQGHIDLTIRSDPASVPDRTRALLHGGEDFVPAIVQQLYELRRADVAFAAIACITAHARLSSIRSASPLPILDMIDETCRLVHADFPNARVGILGTEATIRLRLFAGPLTVLGHEIVATSDATVAIAHEGIYCVKASRLNKGRRLLRVAACELAMAGAQVIILGCTEIPLVLTETTINGASVIDPTRILAKAIIREARSS